MMNRYGFAFCLSVAIVILLVPFATAATTVMDMAYPCGFTNPAFCDNFSEGPAVAPFRGRGNDLDSRRWSFNRTDGGLINAGGAVMGWGQVANVQHCKINFTDVDADQDTFFCGLEVPEPEHWMETLDSHGGYDFNDARIRQPFDFTGRTGLIQYGVDAKHSGSHGWWLETWVTDTAMPGPNKQDGNAFNASLPQNGIGIRFAANCGASPPATYGTDGAGVVGIDQVWIVNNYRIVANPVSETGFNTGCVSTKPDSSNMIQIRLSTGRVEVWGSNNGSNVLQQMYAANITPILPFSVGFVHFVHAHYNPAKCGTEVGCTQYQTYHWHDMGFDGPVHPTPNAYEISDTLIHYPGAIGDDGTGNKNEVGLGYLVRPDGSISLGNGTTLPVLTFQNVVIPANAPSATLNLVAGGMVPGSHITYQFNNGPQRTYTSPINPADTPVAFGVSIPVPVSDLQSGANTLHLSTDNNYYVYGPGYIALSNIELEVSPPDSATPAPAVGMIPCSLMNLMMNVMPNMSMPSNPCGTTASALPVINSPTSATAVLGNPFGYQIAATNNPTSFGASPLPPGLSVDPMSGVIYGAPTTAGNYTIQLSVANSVGPGAGTLNLSVSGTPTAPPIITSAASASGVVGQSFNFQIVANNIPTSYAATGLPPGLAIDAATGLISGRPTTGGTWTVSLGATNALGTGKSDVRFVIAIVPNLGLPWTDKDIGSVVPPGGASVSNSTYTLQSGWGQVWTGADNFHFSYQSLNGDGSIVARIENSISYGAQAGIMIRATADPGSPNAMMTFWPNFGMVFESRLTPYAGATMTNGIASPVPVYVKLVRSGNDFTGYYSADGTNWTLVGSATIPMANPVLIGMAAGAGGEGDGFPMLSTSLFDHVAITGISPGAPPARPTGLRLR